MSHEEAFSDLAAVALDAVNADVAHAVRSHAAACPECGPELAAMEEAVARLGELVPSAQMNRGRGAGIRSRLLMRARTERESQSAPVPGPPDLSRGVASLTGLGARGTPGAQKAVTGEARRVTPAYPQHQTVQAGQVGRRMNWLAMAAGLALVATGAQLVRVTADRNSIREQLAAADTVTPVNDSLALVLNQKDAMIAAMGGNDVKIVPLLTKSATEPLGRMVWNRASDDWIMVTYNLKQPSAGKTYQVWLVTDTEKISAGTFRPGPDGKTVMHAHYVLARDALRAVAITEEPEGGVPAPTGPMVGAGSV